MNTAVRASIFFWFAVPLSSGCVLHRTPESPVGSGPIVGAWIYDPAGVRDDPSEACICIFQGNRRFDAGDVPDPAKHHV